MLCPHSTLYLLPIATRLPGDLDLSGPHVQRSRYSASLRKWQPILGTQLSKSDWFKKPGNKGTDNTF
jgi:hypothetical protein